MHTFKVNFSVCRIDSFCKKNRPFDSLVLCSFFAYLLYSISRKKYTTMHAVESYTVQNIHKNSYAMHTIKITANLLFEYQCTSGKFIRLPNRIEKIDSVARIELNRNFFARIGML